jgi:hypothetical protein
VIIYLKLTVFTVNIFQNTLLLYKFHNKSQFLSSISVGDGLLFTLFLTKVAKFKFLVKCKLFCVFFSEIYSP